MKFWGRFSRSIFRFLAKAQLIKVQPKLLESVLRKSTLMLDIEMLSEIRSFILSQQTKQGGFADRGGKTDLYYSLFGYFVAEALSVTEVNEPLKIYTKEVVGKNKLTSVYLYCGAILYAKLIGLDETTEKLRIQIVSDLAGKPSKQPEYSGFLGVLALFYLEDFLSLQRVLNQFKGSSLFKGNLPCPVVAANAFIQRIAGRQSPDLIEKLMKFHRENGGFCALHRAPSEDLLSTGVALFALQFLEADLRFIKPDCLGFIDDLYDQGGFRSTSSDSMTDIEYTFYGLLALGSLS